MTDGEAPGIDGDRKGRKWLLAVGGPLALQTILGLIIVSAADCGAPPIASDQGECQCGA